MQRFTRVQRNIPNIHPAAVIVAFQSNVRNRQIHSKMNVRLPKTVNKLYTLADKCACTKEGRRLPGEEDGVEVDSQDDDNTADPKRKNNKCKEKAVLDVEDSGTPSTDKKATAEAPGKVVAACTACWEAAAAEKAGKCDGLYCKIHWTNGHDL